MVRLISIKRSALFALAIITLAAASAAAQDSFSTYANARFGYAVDFPSDLVTMQEAPANDDGREFLSDDGAFTMRVWGEYNAVRSSLSNRYRLAAGELGKGVAYKHIDDSSFVVSGTLADKIVYQKTLQDKKGGVEAFYTLRLQYPASDKAKYDAVVTEISRSFKRLAGGKN